MFFFLLGGSQLITAAVFDYSGLVGGMHYEPLLMGFTAAERGDHSPKTVRQMVRG